MAVGHPDNDYRLFNLNGPVEYFDKLENGYPVLEIHEFCCHEHQIIYVPEVMAEGHIYDQNIHAPQLLVRNIGFYCVHHRDAVPQPF